MTPDFAVRERRRHERRMARVRRHRLLVARRQERWRRRQDGESTISHAGRDYSDAEGGSAGSGTAKPPVSL